MDPNSVQHASLRSRLFVAQGRRTPVRASPRLAPPRGSAASRCQPPLYTRPKWTKERAEDMTSLFRLAQSAINPALHGYSNPHHESHHLTDPDLDAFAEPDLPDDQDDSDDDDQTLDHYARGQSGGANATSSSSSSSPAAGTSSAYPPANAQEHRLPGGYDFEPQAEPIRSVAAAAPPAPRTTSSSRDGASALPISRRASLSSQRYRESSSSYATEYGAPSSASAGGEQPALAVWRGFVTRLRGSNAGGSTGGGAQQQHAGEEGHGLLFSQDDSEDPSDADWPLQRSNTAGGGGASQYPPPRDPHLPLPPRPPQFAPPPSSSSSASVPTGSTTNAAGTGAGGQRVFGGGQGNDGVFANLTAKPDNPGGLDIVGEGPDKDEVLPVRSPIPAPLCPRGEPCADPSLVRSLTKPPNMTPRPPTGRRLSSLRVAP